MGKTTTDISMSLDGFIAGPNVSMDNPMGDGGEGLHDWIFSGKSESESTESQERKFENIGAVVLGRRMYDLGVKHWGDNPVFHAPVYVVTHRAHENVVKQGGTTYFFVTDGIERAFEQAKAAAGDKDIMVQGGANVVQQFLQAGWLDELQLHLIPVLLGGGVRLFAENARSMELASTQVTDAAGVTHLTYSTGK